MHWFSFLNLKSLNSESRAKRVYLDYASAPPVLPVAERAMREAHAYYGNPGAIHREGVEAKRVLEDARARVASLLGVKPREVVFTSGLTESNNVAILGLARRLACQGVTLRETHWIVSSIEHSSVLECFGEIERLGGIVTHIDPDSRGIISPESIARALRPETVLVSIGWGNNEIGTLQPLREISQLISTHEKVHSSTILLHSDAGQALLYSATLVHSLGVDLLSIGSNKLYGPHGIGALCLSKRAEISGVILGGKQERGIRAGTENIALASGFAAAFEQIAFEREAESKRIGALRDEFARDIQSRIEGVHINGDLRFTMPHMLNISIPEINSEYVTLALDSKGVAVSTKSACREGEESQSHVVYQLGDVKNSVSSVVLMKEERARNTLRFSLGRDTRAGDLRKTAEILADIVHRTPR